MGFLNGIKRAVRLPLLSHKVLLKGRSIGRNILDATGSYEGHVASMIARHSLPKIAIYPNERFKTSIYKASDPSPCLDEIFYKQESLLPYGKEYWFAIFTSLDKKKNPMQLISSFGRRNSRKSVVDNVEISGRSMADGALRTGAFAWCYDGRRKLAVPTIETMTTFSPRSVRSAGDGLSIEISGTAPAYKVRVESEAINCDFDVRKPSRGYDEEILNELKMGLNYQVYNLYYDFDGRLNKKECSGRCYLQKVILSTPLVPWYWSRFVFKDGSSFVFFKPYFGSRELNYALRNKGAFYNASEDKLYWVHDIDVKHDKKMRNWKFTSKGADYTLNVAVKAYADHGFSFKYGGAFNYNEHMANVKKFDFVAGGSKVDLKKLGFGAGIVEDATGLLI
ncbi:hypothetical protein [Methanocella conradii]|uniref:hypothetical protein n=1 Tax=Methanocella conradii TaxID=1175444 RepID=UPI00157C1B44|nr:hypothetical protein [Methanocella conradii]